MKNTITILIFISLFSCNQNKKKNEITKIIRDTIKITEKITDTVYIERKNLDAGIEFYIQERLPEWFLETELLNGLVLVGKYKFDNRFNPLYLETDLNGDGIIDIAIPIFEIKTKKNGFAIIHGKTKETYIIGSGTKVKNGHSDDMSYINLWNINRKRKNEPGIDNDKPLIIKNNSLKILKSEVGGGIIFWNGTEYEYFHQTC